MTDMNMILEKLLFEAQHANEVEKILAEADLMDQSLWQPIGNDFALNRLS